MPLGGDTIGWNEASPANSDLVGQGDDQMRSIRSNVRGALDSEHNFPSTGGANSGYHRYGSARPFVEPASRVSSSGTAGRLIFNSTDSSFWNSGAADASLIGHPGVLINPSLGNAPSCYSTPAKFYTLTQYGVFVIDGLGSASSNVTFASAYSGKPLVHLTMAGDFTAAQLMPLLGAVNASGFSARIVSIPAGTITATSKVSVNWMSIGTASAGLP